MTPTRKCVSSKFHRALYGDELRPLSSRNSFDIETKNYFLRAPTHWKLLIENVFHPNFTELCMETNCGAQYRMQVRNMLTANFKFGSSKTNSAVRRPHPPSAVRRPPSAYPFYWQSPRVDKYNDFSSTVTALGITLLMKRRFKSATIPLVNQCCQIISIDLLCFEVSNITNT